MIKIKTIVEITGVLLRKDLKPELQKMSLKELRNFVLNHNSETENILEYGTLLCLCLVLM